MTHPTTSAAPPRRERVEARPHSLASRSPTAPAGTEEPGVAAVVCPRCSGTREGRDGKPCVACKGRGRGLTERELQEREDAACAAEDREG